MKQKIWIISMIIFVIGVIIIFINIYNIKGDKFLISSITNTNNKCLKKGSKCNVGTLININVNKDENYNFYVINDNRSVLTLIMDKNIENNINWTNEKNCTNGPNILIDNISKSTEKWDNIEVKEYLINDSNKCYEEIREKLRARIPNKKELEKLGCKHFFENTCPNYIVENLSDENVGYWLNTSRNPMDKESAYAVNKSQVLVIPKVDTKESYGLRLVIEVNK